MAPETASNNRAVAKALLPLVPSQPTSSSGERLGGGPCDPGSAIALDSPRRCLVASLPVYPLPSQSLPRPDVCIFLYTRQARARCVSLSPLLRSLLLGGGSSETRHHRRSWNAVHGRRRRRGRIAFDEPSNSRRRRSWAVNPEREECESACLPQSYGPRQSSSRTGLGLSRRSASCSWGRVLGVVTVLFEDGFCKLYFLCVRSHLSVMTGECELG